MRTMTMHCQEVQNLMPEMVRGELSPAVDGLVHAHMRDCRTCAVIDEHEQRLQQSLRALPLPPMPEDFPARALRKAREADRVQRQRDTARRMSRITGIAASVLMVCGIAFMLGRGSVDDATRVVNVPLGHAQLVALKIDAPQDFEHVEFEVTLPENVALKDQPNLREFAWTGQLQAGVNVLSLPLVGIKEAGGQLVARVKYGTTEKSLHIPLTVSVRS